MISVVTQIFGDPRALVARFIGRGVNMPTVQLKADPDPCRYVRAWRANNVAKGLTQAGKPRKRQWVNRSGLSITNRPAYIKIWNREKKLRMEAA